jgi:predicted DNA-binding protein (MmcQ/YjbR family)
MWLDDAELQALVKASFNLVQAMLVDPPRSERERRTLRTVLLPGTESGAW